VDPTIFCPTMSRGFKNKINSQNASILVWRLFNWEFFFSNYDNLFFASLLDFLEETQNFIGSLVHSKVYDHYAQIVLLFVYKKYCTL
jgi:hypothetical protein